MEIINPMNTQGLAYAFASHFLRVLVRAAVVYKYKGSLDSPTNFFP